MKTKDYSNRYCIIGAGAAGITAAKNLRQQGVPFDLIEREEDVGGTWNYGKPCSSIYRSVHTISSREFTEYVDYPIPKHVPTYLRARDALAYLRDYARHFGVYQHAEFGRSVLDLTPVPGSAQWDVTLDGGETRRYLGVIVANGHLCKPRLPDYPGHFDGLQLHSAQYKTPDVLWGKRVLVVGAGNSGCDIAVEAAHHGAAVFHSTRRGYYYWPKFVFGIPVDRWAEYALRMRMPVWARRFFGGLAMRMHSAGKPEDYNLPKPDHKLFESHFIVNSTLFYHLGHGDLAAKPDVKELRGNEVLFADGTTERIDVIIYATGFELSFPFIDQKHLAWKKSHPKLDMNMFDRQHKNLFFIGLFQTSTGNWPIMDYQSQLLSRYLNARSNAPEHAARVDEAIRRASVDTSGGVEFSDTPRHSIEVEHFSYRLKLRRLAKKLPAAQAPKSLTHAALAPQA